MGRAFTILGLVLLLSSPALAAGERSRTADPARPRLVVGGMDSGPAGTRSALLSMGSFSVGAIADTADAATPLAPALPFQRGGDHLAVGGYAAWGLDAYRLETSFKGDGHGVMSADLGASYLGSVMGIEGTTALKLGTDWMRSGFSVNRLQPGLAGYDAYRPANGLSLSLSWSHEVSPALSFGGVASANRPVTPEAERGFTIGAGLGYKF